MLAKFKINAICITLEKKARKNMIEFINLKSQIANILNHNLKN